jgi:hypothetical protein
MVEMDLFLQFLEFLLHTEQVAVAEKVSAVHGLVLEEVAEQVETVKLEVILEKAETLQHQDLVVAELDLQTIQEFLNQAAMELQVL